ncbi:MAG TPA: restriction endonuclease subunit S [Prevotella sp.]|nr:restriction endonuclease subunit S [Prevotella sp.]
MELKKYKLADIGKVITGKTPSTSIAENYAWGTIPFYTPEDVAKGLGMMGRNSRFISKTGFEEIASNTISGESVLVGCIGSDMGNVAYSNITCATNQQINAITQFKNGIEPLYVYYLLSTMKSYFQKIAGSTTTPILPKSVFEEIEIHLPDMKKQKEVVSILYALDRKIELNKLINDNLEAMAKQLYDYWFVQFDFPNEEGKPYKSSGGAMVWNEKLKREIPQGWSVLSVNDIAASVRGVSYAKEDMVDSNNGVLVLRGNNIQDNHLIYDSNVAYIPSSFVSEEQRIRPLDIIMTMSSGSKEHIGKSAMFQFASEDTFGAFLTKFTAKEHCAYLLFNLFNSQYFKAKIKSIACGTGINNLTNQTFDEIYIVMPEDKLLLEFDKRQSQIFAEIGLIEKSNVELTKQRDELLPLLMNGQATVNYHLSSTPTTAFGMINKASTGIIGTAKFDMD